MATLSSLPAEMVENVARYLDASDLLSFRQSCRHACYGSENTFLERFFSTRRHIDTHYSLKALIEISEHRYLLKRLKRVEIYAGLRLKVLPGDPEDAERAQMRTPNFDTRLESMSWFRKEHLSVVDAAANDIWPEPERASLDDFYSLSRRQQQQTFHPMYEFMATVLRNLQRHNIVVELFARSLPLKKWIAESGDDVNCGVAPFGFHDVVRKELGYYGRQLASSRFTMQCTRGGPALLLLSAALASVSYPVQSFGLGGVHDLKRNEAYDHIAFAFAPMRTWPESILEKLVSLSLARTTTMLPRAPTEFTSQLCALTALHLDRGIHNRTRIRQPRAEGVDSGRPLKMLECQKALDGFTASDWSI